jgi:transcription termination factor NusB
MKIKGWEKISGLTYKGYSIVNPIHNAGEEVYYATILNLNQVYKPKWDIELTATPVKGVITFRIKDNETQHLLAKSHLTKPNIETLQQFREQYEMLVDDILEQRQHYVKNVTKNINGGTTGIINQVQNAVYGSSSLSTTFTPAHLLQTIKDLQEQIDKLNSK